MNARLLEKIIEYRTAHRLPFSRLMIAQKIFFQFSVVQRKDLGALYLTKAEKSRTISELLLIEARAAKTYWTIFGKMIGRKAMWSGRRAHGDDPLNKLLDIGYHYLAGTLTKLCEEIELPTELGFFHKAQSSHAYPFVYDFMEWLRPVVIDATILQLVGKKKKAICEIRPKLISRFIWLAKQRYASLFYHKKLTYCIPLNYWTRLILLEFMHTVRENKEYAPHFPSLRHETRCNKKPPLMKRSKID